MSASARPVADTAGFPAVKSLGWLRAPVAALHFGRRLRFSQVFARARLRWRQGLLARRGLAASLPRTRAHLATDWQVRLAGWQVQASSESAWQELPGRKFRSSPGWLALGPQSGGAHASELHRLELFYHEFLVENALPQDQIPGFLKEYLDGNRRRAADRAFEWNPYAVTTRLANWLQLLAGRAGVLGAELSLRLAGECLVLADYSDWMQETDLLANHWLKNLWVLALSDWLLLPERSRALRSCQNYLRELERQFLPDGAHYELCPMYHARILAELALFRLLPGLPDELITRSRERSASSRCWLSLLTIAPEKWANFNDSWHLPGLAATLEIQFDAAQERSDINIAAASGFVRLQSKEGWCAILDAGGVGPEFNPGHSHSDVLSVIASYRGSAVLQDPGVLHYSPNDERAYLKSAQAHNGPCLADRDHTEIIGTFRIGRAASGRIVETSQQDDQSVSVLAEHHGYSPLLVQRCLTLKGNDLQVQDTWRPEAAKVHFRPWLRLLLMTQTEHVQNLSIGDHRLAFDFVLPGAGAKHAFRLQMAVTTPREVRWYVGESFVSEQFGRTAPALEICVTDELRDGPLTIETLISALN